MPKTNTEKRSFVFQHCLGHGLMALELLRTPLPAPMLGMGLPSSVLRNAMCWGTDIFPTPSAQATLQPCKAQPSGGLCLPSEMQGYGCGLVNHRNNRQLRGKVSFQIPPR